MPTSTAVFEKPTTDQWTHAELNLPQGGLLRKTKVDSRSKDKNDEIKGSRDLNTFLNNFYHDVELPTFQGHGLVNLLLSR